MSNLSGKVGGRAHIVCFLRCIIKRIIERHDGADNGRGDYGKDSKWILGHSDAHLVNSLGKELMGGGKDRSSGRVGSLCYGICTRCNGIKLSSNGITFGGSLIENFSCILFVDSGCLYLFFGSV